MTIHEYLMKARQDDDRGPANRDALPPGARRAVDPVPPPHVLPLRRGGWPG